MDEIRKRTRPIAEKYGIKKVFVFGSYAKGTAKEKSDIDFIIEKKGSRILSLFDMGALYSDFEKAFGEIDLVTLESIRDERGGFAIPGFADAASREMVEVYAG
jgi:predicted nucleotidyltransferase